MVETGSVPLKSLCDPDRSITYGIVQPGKLHDGGIPIVRVNNFRGNRIDLSERSYVSPEIEASYSRCRPKPNDILISLVGSIGQVAVAPPEIVGWNLARAVGLVPVPDAHHSSWIFYALQTAHAQSFIQAHANTTVQATFNLKDLANLPIPYPEKQQRSEILTILSSLDDKIELNRRVNETLEALAQAIFTDWFVDFGPIRRKLEGATDPVAILGGLLPDPARAAKAAALFPERLSDDGLPEKWEEKSLLELAEWVNGAAYKNMHFVPSDAGMPVVKIAELKAGITAQTKFTNTDLGEKFRIRNDELLFSWSGNPDTSIDAFIWTGGDAWLNQHIFAVRINGERSKPFLYVMLKFLMPEFAELARNKQTTGLGHVTKADMKNMLLPDPNTELIQVFSELIEPIFKRITLSLHENRTLTEIRDYLLPKLMSGEMRVRDAEKLAG